MFMPTEDRLPKKTAVKTAKKAAKRFRHSPMEHPRHQYPRETEALQEIARSCGLTEKIKWGKPCYMLGDRNIVLIQRFNDAIALMFFKGALLKDAAKLLCRVGEHMQAPRTLRFTTVAEVERLRPTIKAYLEEAIALEESGAKVPLKKAAEYEMPAELEARLDADPALRKAFDALTPGRRKGYFFHLSAAKQSSTRAARVERCIPMILAGKGLHDPV
jgi:uncharacterized protein YdeI (YjbR/CyaY-like superfamily)